MKFTRLEVKNLRCFKGLHEMNFSDKINIFVGHNNSGKSTLLKALYYTQEEKLLKPEDITLGEKSSEIRIKFKEEPVFVKLVVA